MDPRCFVDHFNALASVTQSTHVIVQHLRHQLNNISEILRDDFSVRNSLLSMASSVRRLEEDHLMGNNRSSPPPKGVIKFSISSKALTNRTSVADVTITFFVDNYPAGFTLDKESDSWKDLDASERKRLRNHFAASKRAVRMTLMHADSYPPTPDKEVVQKIATTAEEHIRNKLDFGNKTISIYTLALHQAMKELEKTLNLPENTPEDARMFFKNV